MAYQSSNTFLLYAESATTADTFLKLGGCRDLSVSLANGTVDITNKDSLGLIELLEGKAGVQMSITASGVYNDSDTVREELDTTMLNGSFREFAVKLEDTADKYLRCTGLITNLTYAGGTNGEVTYSLSITGTGGYTQSTGGVTLV